MSLQSHIRRTWWSPKCSPSLLGSHSFLCPPFWHLLRLFIFWFEETKAWRSSSHYISKNFFFFFKYCQQFKSLHVVNVYICSLWIWGGANLKVFFFFFFPKRHLQFNSRSENVLSLPSYRVFLASWCSTSECEVFNRTKPLSCAKPLKQAPSKHSSKK